MPFNKSDRRGAKRIRVLLYFKIFQKSPTTHLESFQFHFLCLNNTLVSIRSAGFVTMGIKDLLPSLADVMVKDFPLSDLKGKRVAVDASGTSTTARTLEPSHN